MLIWSVRVYLEALIYRVCPKLPIPGSQICFDELFHAIQNGCHLESGVVHHRGARVSCIDRIRSLNIKAVIMDDTSEWIAPLLHS